ATGRPSQCKRDTAAAGTIRLPRVVVQPHTAPFRTSADKSAAAFCGDWVSRQAREVPSSLAPQMAPRRASRGKSANALRWSGAERAFAWRQNENVSAQLVLAPSGACSGFADRAHRARLAGGVYDRV